jgi:CRISPR/Cas system-associated exonuclease Cas4 (RecB family)
MRNLSVSKIEAALLCPKKFRYQYVDKIPQPSSYKLVAGNVVHEILERAFAHFAKHEKYPDWKYLDDMYEPTWQEKVREEEARDSFIGWGIEKDDPMERIKTGHRPLIKLAREKVLPTMKPWMMGSEPMVEYRMELELQSEIGPFKLLGYIDLVEDQGILMDWKTTDEEVSARAQRTWLQFAAYSMFVYPIVGEENLRCEKIFLVRAEKPFIKRVAFTVGEKHRAYFANVAAQVWQMMNAGVFLPNVDGWICKPGWCPYWMGCQGEVTAEKAVDPEAEAKAHKRNAAEELYDALFAVSRMESVEGFHPTLKDQVNGALAKAEGRTDGT